MMSWSYTPYVIPLLAAAVVSLGLIYPVWQRRHTNSALPLAAFAMLAALWCLGYALEIGWQTIEGKLFWVKIQYIAIVYVPPTFLLFCLRYTKLWRWPQRWQLAFFVLPSLILVSVWLEPGLGWFYRQVELDDSGSFLNLALDYGPLFWLHTGYSYLLLLAGALLLLQRGWRLARPYRRQTYALVAAIMLPWVGNAVYLSNVNPLPYLDWTPIGFVGTAVFLFWTLRRLQLLNVAPVARELVFDSITDAVLVWSRQDRLLDFNATASALFHIAIPDDVGLAKDALFNGRFQSLRAVDITDSSGQVVKIHNAYGALYYQVIVSPILDHQGKENGRLFILQDKTTSEKAKADISKARDEAEAANRAKSAFLTTMSHELRTPLAAIIGYNELAQELLTLGAAPDRIVSYLQKIDLSAQHLLALITDILDIATIEAGNLVLDIKQTDLDDLVQQVIQTVDVLVTKNDNRLIIIQPTALGTTATDPKRLRQILLNLFSNAAKFTQQGTVTFTATRDGDRVQFKIADTGIGMTQTQIAQLFRPFMQADTTITRKYGGAGMGLLISQQISRLLGGKISVESEYGLGSTFTLNLPVTKEVAEP